MKHQLFLMNSFSRLQKRMYFFRLIAIVLTFISITALTSSCSKEGVKDAEILTGSPTSLISETVPANLAETVSLNPVVSVTFKSGTVPAEIATTSITLQNGTTPVAGTTVISGTKAVFTPTADLNPGTTYTATVKTVHNDGSAEHESSHSWNFKTGDHKNSLFSVVSAMPVDKAINVALNVQPAVTFSTDLTVSMKNSMTLTLKQGLTTVPGAVSINGRIATFKPSADLKANTVYTAMIASGISHDGEDDNIQGGMVPFSWSFTTAGGTTTDVIAPTVLSVFPANNATGVAISNKPSVTFSEPMNASTITISSITLKQGSTTIAGTVTISGTTATFTPSTTLAVSTVYTETVTTAVKDLAGNAIAANYTWSFTTAAAASAADVTAPTVLNVAPASGASSVAVNSAISATFSEPMTATTITATNFSVKQGMLIVAGTVTYAGNTATFTPSVSLTGMMPYTATITTGVKDLAGNAMAANYTWNFTTVAVVAACGSGTQSFSANVLPIVTAKCTPCHGASGASAGISLTNYAQVKAIGSRLDNPGMYSKMSVDACSIAIIKAWIAQGSLNN
jgi:hypothetical protein